MDFVAQFWDLVSKAQTIVITSHESPDDDSIGSSIALLEILTKKFTNKNIRVLYSGSPENRYSYFKLYEKVEFAKDMADILPKDTDLLICLDGSQYSRFSKNPEKLSQGKYQTICIDHHSSPVDNFTISLVDENASSTTELIYRLLGKEVEIDKELAEILMLGILGDTGTFSYLKSNQLEVFDIAKDLMRIADMEIQDFKAKYDTLPSRVFEIIKRLTLNTQFIEVAEWPTFMTIYLEREFISENKYTDNEISAASHIFMSNYFRIITGYSWGISVTPKNGSNCSISIRSLPNSVNCRSVLERMKLGGGHDRAAGGTFKAAEGEVLDPKECLTKVVEWLKQNEVVVS
ncbi:MAG: DHH family phosphoesterase [Patescibacteria group bacterium]